MVNLSPLHSQVLHVAQQQILLIVDISLHTLLDGLNHPHSHHVYSELSLSANCQYSLVNILQLQSFDALYDGLELEVESVVADLVYFCEDDLDSDVVFVCSFQKLNIRFLQAVLEVDAEKDLRKPR